MSDYIILDTDVFSKIYRTPAEAARLDYVMRDRLHSLTFISVGELLYGAKHGKWGAERTAELRERIQRMLLIPFDERLPETWAWLRDKARRAGHPLAQPTHANDLWIAACAVRYEAPLLTLNSRHFSGLPEINVIDAKT